MFVSADMVVVLWTLGRYLIGTCTSPIVYRYLIDTWSILGQCVGRSCLLYVGSVELLTSLQHYRITCTIDKIYNHER